MDGYPEEGKDFVNNSATFYAEVDDASPAANDVGTAFVWQTQAGGGAALTEKMRLSATGTLQLSHAAAGEGFVLETTATTYTSFFPEMSINRNGNITGVDTEKMQDFEIFPSFTLIEPASGTFNYVCASIDLSSVSVTAGVGTSVITALELVASEDADSINRALSFTGHIQANQTTAPTSSLTGTTLNAGGGSGAVFAIDSGSTDTAGSFTITAGNGTPTAGKAGKLIFNQAMQAAPKTIIVSSKDADGTNNQIYVTSPAVNGFDVNFNTALGASEVVEFYYWVIE